MPSAETNDRKDPARVNRAWRDASLSRATDAVLPARLIALRDTGEQGNNNHAGAPPAAAPADRHHDAGDDEVHAMFAEMRASTRTDEEALLFHGFHEDEEMRRRGVEALEAVMELSTLADERAAYMEAKRRCPELVATESDPVWFLRFECYNTGLAARRLAAYWRYRLAIFGPGRCFLPMRYSPDGQGAISEEDLRGPLAGSISVLPVHHSSGRSVLFVDRAKYLAATPEIGARTRFLHMHHLMASNGYSRTKGVIFLAQLNNLSGARFWPENMRRLSRMVECGFPIKDICPYVISRPSETIWSSFTEFFDSIVPTLKRNIGHYFRQRLFCMYSAGSTQEALDQLLKWGFKREGLPEVLGGTLTADDTLRWIQDLGYTAV